MYRGGMNQKCIRSAVTRELKSIGFHGLPIIIERQMPDGTMPPIHQHQMAPSLECQTNLLPIWPLGTPPNDDCS